MTVKHDNGIRRIFLCKWNTAGLDGCIKEREDRDTQLTGSEVRRHKVGRDCDAGGRHRLLQASRSCSF